MILKDYLTQRDGYSRGGRVLKTGGELARLAAAVQVSPRHLYQVAMGTRRASWLMKSRIIDATGGEVAFDDMQPELREIKPKRGTTIARKRPSSRTRS